jgi:hypothetical protein
MPALNIELHSQDSRASMAGLLMRLFDLWGLGNQEQLQLLGLDPSSRTTLARYRKGHPLANNRDLLDRVGHLLAIHKTLRSLFPDQPDLAHAWIRHPNRVFDQLSPVQMINQKGFAGLLMVRTYLELQCER